MAGPTITAFTDLGEDIVNLSIMSAPTITLSYASVLGLIFLFLSVNVVRLRASTKISLGFGEDETLEGAVRAHGNFAEYVPFILLLVGMLELQGADEILIRALGGGLIVARLSHAYGLITSSGANFGRAAGAMLTWAILLVASGMGVYVNLG